MEKWRKERNKERKKKEQESAEAISGLKSWGDWCILRGVSILPEHPKLKRVF